LKCSVTEAQLLWPSWHTVVIGTGKPEMPQTVAHLHTYTNT